MTKITFPHIVCGTSLILGLYRLYTGIKEKEQGEVCIQMRMMYVLFRFSY